MISLHVFSVWLVKSVIKGDHQISWPGSWSVLPPDLGYFLLHKMTLNLDSLAGRRPLPRSGLQARQDKPGHYFSKLWTSGNLQLWPTPTKGIACEKKTPSNNAGSRFLESYLLSLFPGKELAVWSYWSTPIHPVGPSWPRTTAANPCMKHAMCCAPSKGEEASLVLTPTSLEHNSNADLFNKHLESTCYVLGTLPNVSLIF